MLQCWLFPLQLSFWDSLLFHSLARWLTMHWLSKILWILFDWLHGTLKSASCERLLVHVVHCSESVLGMVMSHPRSCQHSSCNNSLDGKVSGDRKVFKVRTSGIGMNLLLFSSFTSSPDSSTLLTGLSYVSVLSNTVAAFPSRLNFCASLSVQKVGLPRSRKVYI